MSFSENQTDHYLDDFINGKNPQSDLPAGESDLLKDLVTHYQAEKLHPQLKRRIWQKAYFPMERPKRQAQQPEWVGRLVAVLVVIVGISYIVANFSQRTNFATFQLTEEVDISSEAILPTATPLPLFEQNPELFEYGGYASIVDEEIPALASMQNAGMQWIGIVTYYDPDGDLMQTLARIELAHENNFKVLVSVNGSGRFDIETYPEAYANFVGQLAEAGADAIEIWSGANIDRSMPQEFLGAETYADILALSISAIREGNSDTLIISGAPAPTGAESAFPGQVINDDNFLRQLMELKALDNVDCVGMHYTEGIVPPTVTNGDMRDNYYTRYLPTMLETYREILGEEIPICLTSIGYFSPEGLDDVPEYVAWAEYTSREEQSKWLVDAIEYLSIQRDVPLAFIWHVDYNTEPSQGDPIQNGYSLLP